MATVHRMDGLRVVIYANDHRPAHVHVLGAEYEALFNLGCPEGPPTLRENYGFSRSALARMCAELGRNLPLLCEEWRKLHGSF